MAAPNKQPEKVLRCAIYTRKSTEEGLNQEFNSLHAQREAAEAYILSQRSEGWQLVPTGYSDGGYTGANIERPGVKALLADIEAGKIDCVVVYKVDRLSRSLIDFARMMDLFEKHGVCFVSVTQQFNTNSSLGRLTLNILLSFAQFEREIISERTRDKQVAARKKGKWTGGHMILGYDLDPAARKLVVNKVEAEQVRELFRLYLEGVPVTEIARRFHKLGWRNKQWVTREGKPHGGSPLHRCHLYNLLGNILYTGRVKAGLEVVPGEQAPIIDQQTFDLAQAKLKNNTWADGGKKRVKVDSLLRGMIYCSACGSGMYPTYSGRGNRRYRYYICHRSQQKVQGYCTTRAVSAPVVEDAVFASVRTAVANPDVVAGVRKVVEELIQLELATRRSERAAAQNILRNLKSQSAKGSPVDADIADEEKRLDGLLKQVLRLEKRRIDPRDLTSTLNSFDDLWRSLDVDRQRTLLGNLIEKVGYDAHLQKVTVSFKSAAAKELAQKRGKDIHAKPTN